MTAQILARTAYASPAAPTRTARSLEYDAFARVTHRLKSAIAVGHGGFTTLVHALHDNRSLWTTLAADVADADNGLPQALRAQIFYLSEFTRQHSGKVLTGTAKADILVEINTALMRGLRHEEDHR